MRLQLQDCLEHQLRNPIVPQTLIDGPRRCEPLIKLNWRNRDYLAADRRLGRLADVLEVPASIAKGWCKERKVALINPDGRREAGPWDVFAIGPDKTPGFSPWPDWKPDPTFPGQTRLAPSEFDPLWCPVIERVGGRGPYGELFYLPFGLVQRCACKGDPSWEFNSLVIDLGFESATRHRMAFSSEAK